MSEESTRRSRRLSVSRHCTRPSSRRQPGVTQTTALHPPLPVWPAYCTTHTAPSLAVIPPLPVSGLPTAPLTPLVTLSFLLSLLPLTTHPPIVTTHTVPSLAMIFLLCQAFPLHHSHRSVLSSHLSSLSTLLPNLTPSHYSPSYSHHSHRSVLS